MNFIPYLGFPGSCRDAFTFYADLFGGRLTSMVSYGETPMADDMPAEMRDWIAHASIDLDGAMLMGGDCGPDQYATPTGMTVNFVTQTPEEVERLFAALGDGGTVCMAMEETFWVHRFGVVTDRFGTPWMINCFKPMDEGDCG